VYVPLPKSEGTHTRESHDTALLYSSQGLLNMSESQEDVHTTKNHQQCFILRFWTNLDGQPRMRLIDAQTGQQFFLETFEELCEFLRVKTNQE
jgi:hypothetical protein